MNAGSHVAEENLARRRWLTFREFRATRRDVPNIYAEGLMSDGDEPTPGCVYLDGHYGIAKVEDGYLLVLGNAEYASPDRESLEATLYGWCQVEVTALMVVTDVSPSLMAAATPLEVIFGKPISVYARADAISDGELVDVTETAKEAGFRYPVALTRAAWEDCVAWSEDDTKRKRRPQDESGRLWDVVWMAKLASKAARDGVSTIRYSIYRVPRDGRGHMPRRVTLTAHVGPGDTPAPVITIGFPSDF